MRRLHTFLLASLIAVVCSIGAFGAAVAAVKQTNVPLQVAVPLGSNRQATLYIGYAPGLWCTVGEAKAFGLSIVDMTTRQTTPIFALPLEASRKSIW